MKVKRLFTNSYPPYMISEKKEKNKIKLVKHQFMNGCWMPIGTYYRKNKCKNYFDLLLEHKSLFRIFIKLIKKWNVGFYLNHGINRKLSTMFVPDNKWFSKNEKILSASKLNFSIFLRGIVVLNYAIEPDKLNTNGWMGMNDNPICNKIINNIEKIFRASNGNIYLIKNYPIELKNVNFNNTTIQQLNNDLKKIKTNNCCTLVYNPKDYNMSYEEWWIKNIYYKYINITNNKKNWKDTYKDYQNSIRNRVNYIS